MRISDWSSDVCSSDLAGVGAARRLVGGRLEVGVAEAAVAAPQEHDALADFGEVGQDGLLVLGEHLGAGGHLDDQGRGGRPGHVLALAVAAALGLEVLVIAEVDQGIEAVDGLEDDVAAAPAVAAVGTAELDELLAAERHAAVADRKSKRLNSSH